MQIHNLAPINKMEPFAYFAQMRERLGEVIRGLPPACGVFLPSDDRLAFFLEAAQHAGKACPEDFLLIGVDNQGAEPGHPLSAISSINLDTHTIGRNRAGSHDPMDTEWCAPERRNSRSADRG